jgi:hypothetical protein
VLVAQKSSGGDKSGKGRAHKSTSPLVPVPLTRGPPPARTSLRSLGTQFGTRVAPGTAIWSFRHAETESDTHWVNGTDLCRAACIVIKEAPSCAQGAILIEG